MPFGSSFGTSSESRETRPDVSRETVPANVVRYGLHLPRFGALKNEIIPNSFGRLSDTLYMRGELIY